MFMKCLIPVYNYSGLINRYSDGIQGLKTLVRFPVVQDLSLLNSFQTGYGDNLASYPTITWGPFPRG
jgi:hypothetical protein